MARILVTGGLGFIGSHTTIALQSKGHEVVIIDDLSNSSLQMLDRIHSITGIAPKFEQIDLKDELALRLFIEQEPQLDGVIHFAASKAVGESIEKPLMYYKNNLYGLINVINEFSHLDRFNLIFSSSCTVYGQAKTLPIKEEDPVQVAESPYGNTKQIGEEILKDSCNANSHLNVTSLRYFNPIGAHKSAKIGELPRGVPQNLVPFITQTAIGKRERLVVFGGDYDTPDGTCIRDYIHVMDLAEAHVVAMERLVNAINEKNYEVFNLGTGKGNSVMEVIDSFERVSGEKLNYKIGPRRRGDVISAYANTDLANNVLGWRPSRGLDEAILDAWKWEKELAKNTNN